jgi:NADH:ubiquinone oxidoreductase subunit 5 (subunit L)/multisubunit Na+/H+ antiporter MnhA subunit
VGALAFVGALAALCFVRLIGIALLGTPRSEAVAHAHESSAGLLLPMVLLAGGCLTLSLRPTILVRPVAAFAGQLFGGDVSAAVESLAPSLAILGTVSGGIGLIFAVAGVALTAKLRRRAPAPPTWDCGYAAPTARMQYTASSFAQIASAHLLPEALSPRIAEQRPAGLFPSDGEFHSSDADPLTRSWYEPFFTRWADRFVGLRWVQQGVLHAYLFYILAAVVVTLTWVSLRGWAIR